MKKLYLLFAFVFIAAGSSNAQTINIYDNVLFYDGYAALVNQPTAPDVIRLRNDLFTKKLTSAVLSQIGATLQLNISISAACDNYDRIGNINLALVPKNALTYDPATTQRIEMARFITPFINKNVAPNLVPYTFNVDNVAKILRDTYLNSVYDFWVEFELFGVPYAANTQIVGCSGRNDVFYGTLNFATTPDLTPAPNNTYVVPLNFKKDLNNYTVGASDAIGTTKRTITFTLPNAINNAKLHLITSNHGANEGGEEYNRRFHFVNFDGTQVLMYRPGELTCEPYRIYNTQANGIYGPTPRTPGQWQTFSNWCPGSVIPIRTINVGNLAAGTHTFVINVPAAVFVGAQGYIPVSLYMQGENKVLNVPEVSALDFDYYPNPTRGIFTIEANENIESIQLYDIQGRLLIDKSTGDSNAKIDISGYSNGVYLVKVKSGIKEKIKKIVKE